MSTAIESTPRAGLDSVVLTDCRTDVERDLIAQWAHETHPHARVTDVADLDVESLAPDVQLRAARVVWLPPEQDGQRRVTVADLLALTNPRRPRARTQRRIVRTDPDRVRVVVGDPASVAELRSRYAETVAPADCFADFVVLTASLSAERAERAVLGDRYKVPRLVAEQIESSARFHSGAAELARKLKRPDDEVRAEAAQKLATFVATQSRVMGDVLDEMFRRLYDRAWQISADPTTLEPLRELNKSHALVFLPSHRTYMDPFVLSAVLRDNDFPPNHVLGGDNMSFWPLGAIGRRAGKIFIRRKFGDDPVYRYAMRSYLTHLVDKRFNLEWYIEGGRSRTGKLRPPMLGLLSYVADAAEEHATTDVMVVPTSIIYDQLPEVSAIAAESGGGAKSAESLGWLIRYARAQQTPSGSAQVRFGEPFSLQKALSEAGSGRARLEKVAFRVLDGINAVTPITATSLVSFALLGAEPRAFTRGEIESIVTPLLDYIARRGLPGPDPDTCRGDGLEVTLGELRRAGVVSRFGGGRDPVWSVTADNHRVAAYYRNGAVHHLVNRAIVELAMLGVAEIAPGKTIDELFAAGGAEALRIRDLLKFEFFFPAKDQFLEQLRDELVLFGTVGAPPDTSQSPVELLAAAPTLVARRTLKSFFDAERVVAEELVALGAEPVDTEEFLTRCLGVGRQLTLQRAVSSFDSVSRELYSAALQLATNRGLHESADAAGLRRGRGDFLAEVTEMTARLTRIAELEAATS